MQDDSQRPKTSPDISGDADLLKSVQGSFGSTLKEFLTLAQDSGLADEIDEELKKPEAQKSFDDFNLNKGDKSVKLMERQLRAMTETMMTMQIDPNMTRDSVGFYEFPYERVFPEVLRRAGKSIPALMIKAYRSNQLTEFANVSDGKRPGFQLVYTDTEKKVSDAEKKQIIQWSKVFGKSFFFVPNNSRSNLAKWMTQSYNDFFDIDKVAIEIVREGVGSNPENNFKGKPQAFVLVDGGTIKHVLPRETNQQHKINAWDSAKTNSDLESIGIQPRYVDDVRYVQVDRYGTRHAAYRESQMILAHSNETTDIRFPFQGFSIVEQSLEIIRYFLDSIIYNYTRRSTGVMPKGMIHVEGATEDGYSRTEMSLFRKLIWGISSGRKDHWKYPIVGTPKGVKTQFIKFHDTSKDMEDFTWMATLVSIMCTYAGLDPESLAMASQKGVLGKQNLFSKESEEGAMFRSQDEGLRFFLHFLSDIINSSGIIEELTGLEGLEWRWVGLDVEDEAKKLDLEKKLLETTASVNEIRVSKDQKTIEVMFGNVNLMDMPGLGNVAIKDAIMQSLQSQQDAELAEEEPEEEPEESTAKDDNQDKGPVGPEANKSMVTFRYDK